MDDVKYELLGFKNHEAHRIIFRYLLILIGALYLANINFHIYHIIVESICVVIAFTVATIAFSTWEVNKDSRIVFLGIAYGFIASFDLAHIFTYKEMGILSDATGNIQIQLCMAARYMESLSFLISFIFLERKINSKQIFWNYFLISSLIMGSIFYWKVFPVCFIDGIGFTPFKTVSEFIICGFLLMGIIYIIKKNHGKLKKVDVYIILALLFTILSEVSFAINISLYDFSNIFGHIFRLVSFYFVYITLIRSSLQEPHFILSEMNFILNKKNHRLRKLINKLELKYKKTRILESENLREKEILNAILESSTNGILVISNDKNIIHVNSQFIKMLNIPPGAMNNITKYEFINIIKGQIHDQETYEKNIERAWKTQSNYIFYMNFLNGKIFEISCSPFIIKGLSKGKVISFRDISEKRKIEELTKEVETRQRLLDEVIEIDYMKTNFFNTITHELRTPINILLGVVQLLMNENNNGIPNEYINILKQNCYRLIKLSDNLIDITKIDSGFMNLNLQNCNIISIVEDITLSVVEYTKSKDITLTFDTDMEERVTACDIYQIERVILNLLSNSIKFTEPGGNIGVNIRNGKESVIISVKDNGIGIPENMIKTVFDRFKQVDPLFTRRKEGSGIGLSIVKSIVEMHGGRILLNSQVGKGSEFVIELPARLVDSNKVNKSAFKEMNVDRINIEFSDIYELNRYGKRS